MDAITPFSEQERREIRELSRVIFYGGNPDNDASLSPLSKKWKWCFKIFLVCIDRRYGNYVQLPESGGVLEQPQKMMAVFSVMRDVYTDKLREDERKRWQA